MTFNIYIKIKKVTKIIRKNNFMNSYLVIF